MKIALLAATEMELETLRTATFPTHHDMSFHIHGVGMMQATYNLLRITQDKPDLIIQCGIAGSYKKDLLLGTTVVVYAESLGDTGSEDHDQVLDLFDLGFSDKNELPFINGLLLNEEAKKYTALSSVKSITVNLAAGSSDTILQRIEKYDPDIETMEGACLHYVCLREKIPFMQFRGISNMVEPRDRSKWKIKEALQSCQQEIIQFIHQLS